MFARFFFEIVVLSHCEQFVVQFSVVHCKITSVNETRKSSHVLKPQRFVDLLVLIRRHTELHSYIDSNFNLTSFLSPKHTLGTHVDTFSPGLSLAFRQICHSFWKSVLLNPSKLVNRNTIRPKKDQSRWTTNLDRLSLSRQPKEVQACRFPT